MDADPHRDPRRGEVALNRDRGLDSREHAREHREAAVAESLHDRPAARQVLALERVHVEIALLDGGLLVACISAV